MFPVLKYLFATNFFLLIASVSTLIAPAKIVSPVPVADTPKQIVLHNGETNKPAPTEKLTDTTHPAPTQTVDTSLTSRTTPNPANDTSGTNPTPTSSDAPSIHATSTIRSNGKTIHLTMTYPSNGGAISGTMSGDCAGAISGNYVGPATENLAGVANINCPQGLFNIPVTITYTGKMVANKQQVTINYTIDALGQKEAGTSTLKLLQ